jgi:hypothetical protein
VMTQISIGTLPCIDIHLDDRIIAPLPQPLTDAETSVSFLAGTEPASLFPARPPRRLSDEEDEDADGGNDDDEEEEDEDDSDDDDEEEDEDEDDGDDDDEDYDDEEEEDGDEDEDEDDDDDDEDEDDEEETGRDDDFVPPRRRA